MQIEWPEQLTPELAEVLGRPNFMCGSIAHAYRDGGGFDIPPKAEAEQAFVIHRFVQLMHEYQTGWKNIANAEISEFAAKAKAKREAKANVE